MNFIKHSSMEGLHAFLSASKYNWVNYTEDKLTLAYSNYLATQRGTELHDFACRCIKLRQRLPNSKRTLNMYVNDAIGFQMEPEQMLVYSDNCFGTADAICFRKNMLRIHDLKTGSTRASVKQLEIYMALFCLEYNMNPTNISSELRLYQSDEIIVHNPHPEDILYIMQKIETFDKHIEKLKIGE